MLSDEELLLLSHDSTKRCHWLQHFGLINIFEHVWKPAIIACNNCSALHAINCTCNHVSRHVSTFGKNLLSSDISSTCPHNVVNFGWDLLASLGHPCKFQRVSHLRSVTARHLVEGVSQTLWRWTEGATYVRQGNHHVGHWPTFLVVVCFFASEIFSINLPQTTPVSLNSP